MNAKRSKLDNELERQQHTRDKRTGQYTHRRLEDMCVCGHSLGVHAAVTVGGERPCFNADAPGGGGQSCPCVKYRKSKKKA